MIIKTSVPYLDEPRKILKQVQMFWDKVSPGWRKIWGPHIHHGYYQANETVAQQNESLDAIKAQEILLDKLSDRINFMPGSCILDVGCGMGETALYLAKKYQANILGITLSKTQLQLANRLKIDHSDLALSFLREDAHHLQSIGDESFDLVWALESCEQFYDKQAFIEQAYRVLKPAGTLMIATWCSDQEIYHGKKAKRYAKLCKEFLLPYMPTLAEYARLIQLKFVLQETLDWTDEVKDSWRMGILELRRWSFLRLLKLGGWAGLKFALSLPAMEQAFREKQLRYGVFIARKI